MLTIFREGGESAPVSMRRVLAFVFSMAAIVLFISAFFFSSVGWYVFIPGIALLVAVIVLLFFTTWTDIAEAAARVKGIL